jgi:hypothetical protein
MSTATATMGMMAGMTMLQPVGAVSSAVLREHQPSEGGSDAVAEQATDRLERGWSFFLPGGKPTADLSIRWKLFRSGARAIRTAGSRWEGYPDEETTWGPLTSG